MLTWFDPKIPHIISFFFAHLHVYVIDSISLESTTYWSFHCLHCQRGNNQVGGVQNDVMDVHQVTLCDVWELEIECCVKKSYNNPIFFLKNLKKTWFVTSNRSKHPPSVCTIASKDDKWFMKTNPDWDAPLTLWLTTPSIKKNKDASRKTIAGACCYYNKIM